MDTPFLYKYRPRSIADFYLDESFVKLLEVHMNMDDLNILFIGNSGCGKTALIQAIIHNYYGDLRNDENIMVINSIKEQGIAFYRSQVKTFCQTCSLVPGKKKIIVLDDLENINEQSQQVLRTCISKYSNNVHFIASCSDTQRVIENLQSLLSSLKINPIQDEVMNQICEEICAKEGIRIADEAASFLIRISNHSCRTLLNYLEKCKLLSAHYEYITLSLSQDICTNISFDDMEDYTELIKKGDLQKALHVFYTMYDKGYSVIDILDNYFIFIKLTKILSEDEKYVVLTLLTKYMSMFYTVHEDEIELAFFTNQMIKKLKFSGKTNAS